MPKTTHGISTYIKHGQLPTDRGFKKCEKFLKTLENGFIEKLGGTATPAQTALLLGTIEAIGVVLLTRLYKNEHGIFRKRELERGILEYQPCFEKSYLAYLNTIRLNLEKLYPDGLGETTKTLEKIGDFFDVSKEVDKENGQ